MKYMPTLSTGALLLAAGSFALLGGCSKEQSASIEQTQPEIATMESQPAAEQVMETAEQAMGTAEQALESMEQADSSETAQTAGDASGVIAGETE